MGTNACMVAKFRDPAGGQGGFVAVVKCVTSNAPGVPGWSPEEGGWLVPRKYAWGRTSVVSPKLGQA